MTNSRICYLISSAEGGIRKHLFDVLDESTEASNRCNLIVFPENQVDALFQLEITKRRNNVRFFGLKINKSPEPADLLNTVKILRQLLISGIKIIHAHGAKAGLYSRIIKLLRPSIQVIYSPHGGSMHQLNQSGMGKLAIYVEKILAKKTDFFVFESAYARSLFLEKISVDSKKITVIPNRVINYPTKENPKIPAYLNKIKSDGKKTIAVVGRIRYIKGHDLLIRAARHIETPIHLVFVGNSDPEYMDELNKMTGYDQVKIWGDESDVISFYKGVDLIVCPSRAESFGYVPCEAILSGAKVVLSRIPAFEESLRATKNAYFFEIEDEISLARAIEMAIEMPVEKIDAGTLTRLNCSNFGQKFNDVYTKFAA